MSKFIVGPRSLEVMFRRATLSDLVEHPDFHSRVDVAALKSFDPRDPYHAVLANVVSEAVYRHTLLQEELAKEGETVSTNPLILRFLPGYALASVTFGPDGGRQAGAEVFVREAGATPKIFRPGGWLFKLIDIQNEEDEQFVRLLRLRHQSVATSDVRYAAVDDGDVFKAASIGFRQRRDVELP